ncbi:unnamed protein product [Moneuplotes crassus]|uniref:Uncharacterized protein n=1 Tax=Euplotes crassus TaxID=5936 RepID=A0AAD1XZB3_EUPCR|nr:unnamed protein product [Moneuplotes crassus]
MILWKIKVEISRKIENQIGFHTHQNRSDNSLQLFNQPAQENYGNFSIFLYIVIPQIWPCILLVNYDIP